MVKSTKLTLTIGLVVFFIVAIIGTLLLASSSEDSNGKDVVNKTKTTKVKQESDKVSQDGSIEISMSVKTEKSKSLTSGIEGPDKLATLPASGNDPELGKTIPTIIAQQFNGDSITLGPTGKPYVILFVAHWCPHCQREIPVFVGLNNENKIPKKYRSICSSYEYGQDKTKFSSL